MSSLEELRKRLYKKEEFLRRRHTLAPASPDNAENRLAYWQRSEHMSAQKRGHRVPVYIWLIIALTVVVLGLFSAAMLYVSGYFDAGTISGRNILFTVDAPKEINGGDRVSWLVSITNNNSVALDTADLTVLYPEGAQPLAQPSAVRERKELGKLVPGETRNEVFEAYVFGAEGDDRTLHATLEYRPEDTSAIFAKETSSVVRVVSSPVGVTVLIPREIRVGQEVEISVEYVSHADVALENLQLEVNYPFDFEYRSSSAQPVEGDNRWRISTLQPGVTQTLLIRGALAGNEFEEKAFRASIGVRGADKALRIYGRGVATTLLKKPFLEVTVRINGAEQAVAFAGEQVTVDLPWRNNLPVGVKNAAIEAEIEGAAVDQSTIVPEDGAMRGSAIVWNAGTLPSLGFLDPGESGRVRMHFALHSGFPAGGENSNLTVTVRARLFAAETPEGFAGVNIDANALATLRVGSRLQLARRGFFYDGGAPNSGPIPPRLGQETVFTIVWSLTNAFNDMKDVTVRAVLPPYMRWKSIVLPTSERITYNEATGELVWEAGNLEAGVGFSRPARAVSFQVGFVPTANQVGGTPILLEASQASGRDTFVNAVSSNEALPLTLFQLDDPRVSTLERRVSP